MACSIEELQKCEYEVLCHFASFCDENNFDYILDAGSLIGAVRHNGFIPWDDDIDVIMEGRTFLKFVKKYRKQEKKNCEKNFSLCWMDSETEYPFYYAKVRKNNTEMVEHLLRGLNINHGVWVDVFSYFYLPKTRFGIKIQEFFLRIIASGRQKYLKRFIQKEDSSTELTKFARFVDKCPDKLLWLMEKTAFYLAAYIGSKKTGKARCYYLDQEIKKKVDMSFYQPVTEHIFCDRMFKIPKNYDAQLTCFYGDYMTPVKTHTHIDLSNVKL